MHNSHVTEPNNPSGCDPPCCHRTRKEPPPENIKKICQDKIHLITKLHAAPKSSKVKPGHTKALTNISFHTLCFFSSKD